jgi:hypothetical protein
MRSACGANEAASVCLPRKPQDTEPAIIEKSMVNLQNELKFFIKNQKNFEKAALTL